MDPNNISCLNTNSYFIAQSSSLELVGVPLLAERLRLVDTEVGAINRYLASFALIAPESIAPANLKGKAEAVRTRMAIAALVPGFLPHKAPCRQSSAEEATPTFETSFGWSWLAQKVPSQFRKPSGTEVPKAGAWALFLEASSHSETGGPRCGRKRLGQFRTGLENLVRTPRAQDSTEHSGLTA
jgi:hypothetical protein